MKLLVIRIYMAVKFEIQDFEVRLVGFIHLQQVSWMRVRRCIHHVNITHEWRAMTRLAYIWQDVS